MLYPFSVLPARAPNCEPTASPGRAVTMKLMRRMRSDALRPVLLIAAHGERGGDGDNRRLLRIAGTVRARLPGHDVRAGVLAGEPSVETALADMADRDVVVAPLFMSTGYFVAEALPRRLAPLVREHRMLPPLGETPAFVHLAARLLGPRAGNGLLIVAHGSTKDARSRNATEAFAARLGETVGVSAPPCAYLEEPPLADEAIAGSPDGAVIVALFAGAGLHGSTDLARLIEDSARSDLRVVTPAADVDGVAEIVADMASAAVSGRS